MFPDKITPEKFIQLIEDGTALKVFNAVKDFFKDKPAQAYSVLRQTPAGPAPQQISLPQAIVELTDAMRIQASLAYEDLLMRKQESVERQALITELKESRKLAKRMARDRDEED